MNHKLQRLYSQLFPFFLIGIAITLAVGLLLMLSWVLIWGIFIGGILWVASLIKKKLSSSRDSHVVRKSRIIEHDEKP